MIAYWFPPEGNAAVYRPLRFLRNLPAFGWKGHVVAGEAAFERYDPDLLRQVPDGTEIVRVAGEDLWQSFQRRRAAHSQVHSSASSLVEAARTSVHHENGASRVRTYARSLARKVESAWYHPDMQRPWITPAVDATLALCERDRPDVVWATGPPFSSFLVAKRVWRRTGIPYVLDFRTSWTVVPSPFEAMRPWWAQHRDRRALRALFKDAQAAVFFYAAEAECFWRMYRDVLDASRIHVIPNGFDGEVEPFTAPAAPRLTILYTGTLADYGFEGFLEALAAFVRRDSARAACLSVQFVGEPEPALNARIDELRLRDVVSVHRPMSHADVTALQRDAHALLMLERRPTHKGHELLAGAKLFAYLRAGKPILGVVPRGEADRILREVGVTTVADAGSVEAIERALDDVFRHWSEGTLAALAPDKASCRRYSGRAQASALARALEGWRPLERFVPGANDVAPSLRSEFVAAGWT
jgi:glycosyltransferase involved in cell wall biosynthesis